MKGSLERTRKLDHTLAMPMFVISLVMLFLFGSLLHLNDLPNFGGTLVKACIFGLIVLYPVFWAETLMHYLAGSCHMKQHIWFCLFPILRIGARDHETGQEVWLPRLGWRETNRVLERMLAKKFSIPMIAIALMVLPIIVLEFFYDDFVNNNPGWAIAMKFAGAFIWAAFTYEFVLMMSIVKYPMGYAKKHWIDLAIILLPMLAFARTMRLTSLMRIKYLSKTARVYRLRGLGMRLWRGFVALEVIEMLLSRNPERRLAKLEEHLIDKQEEINYLKKDIERLKERVAKRKAEEEAKLKEAEQAAAAQADSESHGSSSEEPEKERALVENESTEDSVDSENDDDDPMRRSA